MLVLLPLQMLSGGMTPRESMPQFIQFLMQAAPNTHLSCWLKRFFTGAQDFPSSGRNSSPSSGSGSPVLLSLARFRKTIGTMA